MPAIEGVSGLSSGIDSRSIVDGMIAADRAATAVLERRKTTIESRQTAVRSYNTKLLSAHLDLSRLKLPSTFNARTAGSSAESAVTASAKSSAPVGAYQIDVVNIATAHQLAAAGRASASTAIGNGTITLKVGNGAEKSIAIAAGSSSLNDIALAINQSDAEVTASVVNDGGANPYRLLIQASNTGVANAITISASNALLPIFNVGLNPADMSTLTTAVDAKVTLGGTTPLTIYSSSNTIENIVPDVTLTIKTPTTSTATINVNNDSSGIQDKIKTFFTDLNTAITFLSDNTKYNATTRQAGALLSESDLRSGLNSVIQGITGPVTGLPSSLNALSAIGIRLNRDKGTFDVDEAALSSKLSSDPTGVARLFTNTGTSTSTAVQFAALSSKTQTNQPFAVAITQPAQRALVGTTGAPILPLTINTLNNGLGITINDHHYSIKIASGTYASVESLAEQVQNAINSSVTSNGDKVSVGVIGGVLSLESKYYGAVQSIQIDAAATARVALGFSAVKVNGVDVAGTINGIAATGRGQILEGKSGATSEGLALVVTATSALTGVSVSATKGLAQLSSESISALSDVETGSVTRKDKGYQVDIDGMKKRIKRVDELLTKRRERYEAQFRQMEQLIQGFKSQGDILTSQISGFQNMATSRANGS
jgi:flagellar hook-associated protein 2